ncbi:MAG: heparan-alpha-glucosaminide N-acetyltransferase [Candidatus Micrarchaeota archaeon]|nr:heparan-alpha-glucosaminide N-acetyltransferase [Candidatus Micrarchaeota archaeon]
MVVVRAEPPLQERPRLHAADRIQAIDFARGANLALMVLFNYSVTLDYFGLVSIPAGPLYWTLYPALIASAFIFISGAVARFASQKRGKNFAPGYFARGLRLVVFAAAITGFTLLFVPKAAVLFGILHFFAFTSFLVPLLAKRDWMNMNLVGGLLAIAAGLLLQVARFDFPYLLWLGFVPNNFFTLDYFPVLPWVGVLMLGIYFGKKVVEKTAKIRISGRAAGFFSFLGRNSLAIYLVHQPVLVLLLLVMGFRTP